LSLLLTVAVDLGLGQPEACRHSHPRLAAAGIHGLEQLAVAGHLDLHAVAILIECGTTPVKGRLDHHAHIIVEGLLGLSTDRTHSECALACRVVVLEHHMDAHSILGERTKLPDCDVL